MNGEDAPDAQPDAGVTTADAMITPDASVPDAPEAPLCEPNLPEGWHVVEMPAADTVLVLPEDFVSVEVEGASAAVFSNGRDVFGYVVQRPASTTSIGAEGGAIMEAIAASGSRPTNRAQWELDTWSHPGLEARRALRHDLLFSFGEGTPNNRVPYREPAVVRDDIVSALVGVEVMFAEHGPACAHITDDQITILRPDVTLITVGLLACEDRNANPANSPAHALLFDDIQGSTLIAPSGWCPNGVNTLTDSLSPPEGAYVFTQDETRPIVPTLDVRLDGERVERTGLGAEPRSGWSFDVRTSTLRIDRTGRPSSSMPLELTYTSWEPVTP